MQGRVWCKHVARDEKKFFLMKVALAQVRLKEVAIDQYMIR